MDILIDNAQAIGVFMLLTVAIGGGAAFLTGRAIAAAWRPWWHVLPYMLPLGAAVRFLHFALFGETLLDPAAYALDTGIALVGGLIGFRLTRVRQMVTHYGWINHRVDFYHWRRRTDAESG